MDQEGQVSPDGQWYWDGQKWISTLSPDGASRWDGRSWVPSGKVGPAAAAFAPLPGSRGVARWKLAVGGLVGLVFLGFVGNAIGQQPRSNSAAQVGAVATATAPSESARPLASPTVSPTHPPSPPPSPTPTLAPAPTPVAAATSAPAPADPYAAAKAAGASAVCADGTWSFSKTRSGTCSGHGGVHWWTGNLGPAGPGAH